MPKFDDLQHLIKDLGDCPMVLGLSETWLDDRVGNSEISVEVHRFVEETGMRGEVAVFYYMLLTELNVSEEMTLSGMIWG